MRKSYVYKIICKITGEFYFGSSFNAKSDRYWGGGKRIRERISKYGKDNFIKEILGEFDDRVEAHRVENQYIEQFINDEKCLNIHLDYRFGTYSDESLEKHSVAKRGKKNPLYGKHLSEEVKAKMSASHLGKVFSEEHRARIGDATRGEKNPMFGKHHTEEVKARISIAKLGKHISEEHRAKIGAANSRKFSGKHWRKNPVTGKREWYD